MVLVVPFELEIFKAGKQTSSLGNSREYTTADLDEVVDSYDPEIFKAPLIVSKVGGHDTQGIPDDVLAYSELAFGYPDTLKRIGNKLVACFSRIAPEFVQWVKEGRVLDRSASFYMSDSPNNPYPGVMALRHIAALGNSKAAVPGQSSIQDAIPLSDFASYSAADEGVEEFAYGLQPEGEIARVFWMLREWLISTHGVDETDKALPRDALERIESAIESDESWDSMIESRINGHGVRLWTLEGHDTEHNYTEHNYTTHMKKYKKDQFMKTLDCSEDEANEFAEGIKLLSDAQGKKMKAAFPDPAEDEPEMAAKKPCDMSEAVSVAEFNELKESVRALTTENVALRLDSAKRSREVEQGKIESFVEAQVRDRRVLPDDQATTVARLMAMPTTSIDFAEAQTSARQMLMDEISNRKPLYAGKTQLPDGPGELDFSENDLGLTLPDGFSVDPESAKLFKKAKAYETANAGVSFTEALDIIQRKGG